LMPLDAVGCNLMQFDAVVLGLLILAIIAGAVSRRRVCGRGGQRRGEDAGWPEEAGTADLAYAATNRLKRGEQAELEHPREGRWDMAGEWEEEEEEEEEE
jgi:hypothetical protein